MTDEIVEGEVLSETPAHPLPRAAKSKKVAWYRKTRGGEKYLHHQKSNWVYLLLALANLVGLVLIWTSLGASPQTRWIGLNAILGVDAIITAWVLVSKFKIGSRKESLVAKENRFQLWISVILNAIALATINFSVLEAIGLSKALIAWPSTLALIVGFLLDIDAWRDYRSVFVSEEDDDSEF